MPDILCLPTTIDVSECLTKWFGCPVGAQSRPTDVYGVVIHTITDSAVQSYIVNADADNVPVPYNGNSTFNYILSSCGTVLYVDPENMAWSAGLHCNFNVSIPGQDTYVYGGWPGHDPNFSIAETSVHIAFSESGSYDDLVRLVSWLSQQFGIPVDSDHIATYRDITIDVSLEDRPELDNIITDVNEYCERCCQDVGVDVTEDVGFVKVVDIFGCDALTEPCKLFDASDPEEINLDEMSVAVFGPDNCLKATTWTLYTDDTLVGDGSPDSKLGVNICKLVDANVVEEINLDEMSVAVFDAGNCLKKTNWTLHTDDTLVGDGSPNSKLGVAISQDPCNGISTVADGLFVPKASTSIHTEATWTSFNGTLGWDSETIVSTTVASFDKGTWISGPITVGKVSEFEEIKNETCHDMVADILAYQTFNWAVKGDGHIALLFSFTLDGGTTWQPYSIGHNYAYTTTSGGVFTDKFYTQHTDTKRFFDVLPAGGSWKMGTKVEIAAGESAPNNSPFFSNLTGFHRVTAMLRTSVT